MTVTSDAAPISADEIARYRESIGQSIVITDQMSPDTIRRIAATLDEDWDASSPLPPIWHYGLFAQTARTSFLKRDGHPPAERFMPEVRLPRRMFAGSDISFTGTLRAGHEATRDSRIASVEHRAGRSGDLVFVKVRTTITQDGAVCVEEEQTFVYRGAGGAAAPAIAAVALPPLVDGEIAEMWTPTNVELFRFSAVTFNGHRIHYDRKYAIEVEGYPDLVVTGPLSAVRLCRFVARLRSAPLKRFVYRCEAPTYVDMPVRMVGRPEGETLALRSERIDGAIILSATATFG